MPFAFSDQSARTRSSYWYTYRRASTYKKSRASHVLLFCSLAEPLLLFIPLYRHWLAVAWVGTPLWIYCILYYTTFFVSALSIFPGVVTHRLAWMRGALALCPVSRVPQMEPLTYRAIVFIRTVSRFEWRTAVDTRCPADAPVGIAVIGVLPPVLFNRTPEPSATALPVILPDCFF